MEQEKQKRQQLALEVDQLTQECTEIREWAFEQVCAPLPASLVQCKLQVRVLVAQSHCGALDYPFQGICGVFEQHNGCLRAFTQYTTRVAQLMTSLLLVLMQVESIREEMHLEIHGLVEIIEEQADALHDLEDRLANRLRW